MAGTDTGERSLQEMGHQGIFQISTDDKQNIDKIKVENDVDVQSEDDSVDVRNDEVNTPSAFPIMKDEWKNCMDSVKDEPHSDSETCQGGNQVISVKAEDVSDMEIEEHYVAITFPVIKDEQEQNIDKIKVENDVDVQSEDDSVDVRNDEVNTPSAFPIMKDEWKNCMDSVKDEPHSDSETCRDGNQVISVKAEDVSDMEIEEHYVAITFPVIKDEQEETPATTMHDGVLPKYKKRSGSVGLKGELYGIRLASFLFARGLSKTEEFHLASNVDGAGALDDVVFKYREQKLYIGRKLTDPPRCYVSRILEHQVRLNDDILNLPDTSNALAITGLEPCKLKKYLHASEKIYEFKFDKISGNYSLKIVDPSNKPIGHHNVFQSIKPEEVRYVILGNKHPESNFKELKKFCKNVHWVHVKDDFFVWRDSSSDIDVIRKYIDKTKCESNDVRSILEHNYSTMLLAGEPGMGKTTFLSHMEHEIKEREPSMWVVRLNLNDHTSTLDSTEFEGECIDKCKKFLWEGAHSKEQNALELEKKYFYTRWNRQVAMLAEEFRLHVAVLNNDPEAANKLLGEKTDVNSVDKGGRTALHLAASYNSIIINRLLSVTGVDTNIPDVVLKWTPLSYAAKTRSWMAVDSQERTFLCEPGMGKTTFLSHMEHEIKEREPSMWVVRLNLNDHTSTLDSTEFEGECIDKCKKFLWEGAHSKEQNALELEKKIFLHALEQTGVDTNISDGVLKWTPLRYAAKTRSWMAVDSLLQSGADDIVLAEFYWDKEWRRAALWECAEKGNTKLLEFIINSGFDVNDVVSHPEYNIYKLPLLHKASLNSQEEVVRLLIERGADINVRTLDTRTAL
ncbi:Serine/threonine-protein phosphatase 6 regulatory ankyrin repeat subunit B [Zootermopsis nevadensis]|uniref:Serine/threonine-protein phosphatase 6 regulatory ankyrin repeat subunit B n=1 Tax=Zootermopsis nevadensis TaxID=136037 RepID=A0A067RB60_ZOONE|nr:Serine/threonine-protein phosphatase 6 regulatory ankyrin repeat subunit B [Zootermopsis nevadensis]